MTTKTALWRPFKLLAFPYWQSAEKWRALFLLVVIILLNLGIVYINVRINLWNKDFYNALQDLNFPAFKSLLLQFCGLAFIFIIMAVYAIYLRQVLQVRWRQWLTEYFLGKWTDRQRYYRLQLTDHVTDNPDQRIAEDVGAFVSSTLGLSIGLLNSLVTLFSFLHILWTLSGPLSFSIAGYAFYIPGYMVWVALIYALLGSCLTVWIGKPLVGLNFRQEKLEANFRFGLIRMRENSESIAFYRGEAREKAELSTRLQDAIDNFRRFMKRQKRLTWVTSGYGQIAIIFPVLVAAPRYFAKEIMLGELMQIVSAFRQVQDALSFIIDSFGTLAAWKAVINRLALFEEGLAQTETLPVLHIDDNDDALVLEDVTISKPDGTVLLAHLNLTLPRGGRLLIQGPSGCGKSTLLKTIAGIWPFAHGRIACPQQGLHLSLSQRPYLPRGTLREAFYYPQAAHADETALLEVLALTNLTHLIPYLDKEEQWEHMLSLGEQQRIAIARALLTMPEMLLMDEATSALDEEMENILYSELIKRLPQSLIVSVGHRSTLQAFHSHFLPAQQLTVH